MKKIITFCLSFLACMAANAGDILDVVFADADGNIYEDGTTLNITDATENEFYDDEEQMYIMDSGLYVYNTTESLRYVVLQYTVSEITRGTHSCCFPMTCVTTTSAGSYESDRGSVKAGKSVTMLTEWYTGGDGSCSATYTLQEYEYDSSSKSYTLLGEGPTITVNYLYGTAGINNVSASNSNVVKTEYYDITGRKTSTPTNGVYIKRTQLSDGTVKAQKVIIK